MPADIKEKIEGGLIGLLVGDALGVPYEFNPPENLPALDEIEFEPPTYFHRSHAGVLPGTWSDDGAQALCLLESLLECGKFDAENFAQKLVAWFREDYLAVDQMFDVGIQTQRAVLNLRKGVAPLEAGLSEEKHNGNGSLMRVLPLALWHRGTDAELVADAFAQSSVTHGHLRSKLCCALYCLWARGILNDEKEAWGSAVGSLDRIFPEKTPEYAELHDKVLPAPKNIRGSGYVADSLQAARWLNDEKFNFEDVVKYAVGLGDDTDTTACIAGGIAGIKFGVNDIPARWREKLRGAELYKPLLEKLLERF
jgi:ADP-ribosyl-[dinitrogen reductase] hydrolase